MMFANPSRSSYQITALIYLHILTFSRDIIIVDVGIAINMALKQLINK
jgi:hypothetical protein